MAATNRPEILDPALLRPGRFDRNILVDRPDRAGRKAILEVHLKNIQVDPSVDVAILAGMTPGMAGADLARATDIARSMIKEYGMSSKVGQVYFAIERNNQFLNIPQQGAAEYSQATAKLIDEEVKAIINQQYEKAKEILMQLQHILDNGAELLLEKEKIEDKDLQELLDEAQDHR